MILDPRAYRLDDLLRRPLRVSTWDQDWLTLELRVNGEPVFPSDGFWRPSHQSLYGRDPLAELQVASDSFITREKTQLVTLLLRNPSDSSLTVEIVAHNRAPGRHHCLPPLDDLYFQLPAGALVQRTFTQSLAPDEDTAFKHATRWYFESSPALAHAQLLDDWQQSTCLVFESSDPWLTRLVAHCQALRWRGLRLPDLPPSNGGELREWFQEGDFDAPHEDCPAWDTAVIERLVGVSVSSETLTIAPDNFLGLSSFCLQGFHGATIVWDDPEYPEDAFGDGDKGLTIYVGQARVYNQPTLTPVTLDLAGSSGRFRGESRRTEPTISDRC